MTFYTDVVSRAIAGVRVGGIALPAGALALAMVLGGCNETDEPQAADDATATAVVLTGDEATAAIEAGEANEYPLDACIVSGEALGSMGPAVSMVYEGQTIKFCCPGCDTLFLAEPEKYLSRLEEGHTSEDGHHEHDHTDHADHTDG